MVEDVSMIDLVFEAQDFKRGDSLEYIKDVYLELENFLEKDKTYTTSLQSLIPNEVWPITESGEPESFEQLMSLAKQWYIADTKPLQSSFTGLVPLLAFSTEDIAQMEGLLNGLEMDKKRLSLAVKSIPKTDGKVAMHGEYTSRLQSKYKFIAR